MEKEDDIHIIDKLPFSRKLSWMLTRLFWLKIEKKMKIALYYFQREVHTIATRTTPGDLGLKSHPKNGDIGIYQMCFLIINGKRRWYSDNRCMWITI